MSLMWMKNNAKWVIYSFGVLILAGLVMMDRAGASRAGRTHNEVGVVDGQDLAAERFDFELKQYQRNEEARTGKAPDGIQLAQMRQALFNYDVQSLLLDAQFRKYQLYASVPEMQDWLVKHPQEVAGYIRRYAGREKLPDFLADSTLDQRRYEGWLGQDSIYDRFSMRELEEAMRASIIPQIQLQQLFKAQVHNTALEEAWNLRGREDKARVKYYYAPADSFPVQPDKYTADQLKAYYKAHPDSFYSAEESAQLGYVRIELKPSRADSQTLLEFAKEKKQEALEKHNFAELAQAYSNDPASAEKGGSLGGYQPREAWVPAFSQAAFNLKPGEISDPVLTPFGYHLILCNGKKVENGVEKVDASHILLKITAGAETVDSLTQLAEKLRQEAMRDGLKPVAQAKGVAYAETKIFDKGNLMPVGNAYVQGVTSFAFSPYESKDKISEVLQNEEGAYVFEKLRKFPRGRDFEKAEPRIRELMAQEEKLAKAKQELEAQLPHLPGADAAMPARLGKAALDSSGLIGPDSWLAGFGYASPALYRAFRQPVGEWGKPLTTDAAATVAKVVEKRDLPADSLAAKARDASLQSDTYIVTAAYQNWLGNLQKGAKVENHLDRVYKF